MTKAVERQTVQGNKDAGQTTLDREDRKLTKPEAGFKEDGGIPEIRCGDCYFFEGDFCRIVEGSIDADDVCDQFEPSRKDGNMSSELGAATQRATASLDMYIYRVSENKQTGERRWFATASGVKRDKYDERMSVELFKDFVKRAENQEPAPEPFTSKAWNGGLPYLSVAHYLDLGGFGIVGKADRVYVDGDVFKANGTFEEDSELAERAYNAIAQDEANNVPEDDRVRISIAFIDWSHEHEGHGAFERKSLSQACAMCQTGIGEKIYKKGHLVHLALTRRPAYEETAISLRERSEMPSKRDDAASIVGDDLADELEKRQLESLTERSDGEVDPSAIVVKQEEEEAVEREFDKDEEEDEDEDAEEEMRKKRKESDRYKSISLNGATTLDEAEVALAERSADSAYLDQWDVLKIVLSNIAGEEKSEQVMGVMDDFQHQLDVLTARSVIELNELMQSMVAEPEGSAPPEPVERSDKEVDMPESTPEHPLDDALAQLKSAYDEALETPLDMRSRLHMIQPALESVGEAIHGSVAEVERSKNAPQGGVDVDTIAQVVRDAIEPLSRKVQELEGAKAVERKAPEQPKIPAPRNARRNQQVPASVSRMAGNEGKSSSLKGIIRRSVGLQE